MTYGEVYLAEKTMHRCLEDRRREALGSRPLRHRASWLLSRMSRLLVALGARLVGFGLPPYRQAEADAG